MTPKVSACGVSAWADTSPDAVVALLIAPLDDWNEFAAMFWFVGEVAPPPFVVIVTGVVGGGAIAALVAVGMPLPPPPPPPPPPPEQAARPEMSSVVTNVYHQVRFVIVFLPNKCALDSRGY